MYVYNYSCTIIYIHIHIHTHTHIYIYIYTRCIKNSNLRKEVGIAIKSKETNSQFESVRNSYVATVCDIIKFTHCFFIQL